MLRGAIIGLGNVSAGAHVPGWARRRDARIVAVTDARPERRAVVATALPGARWYDTAEGLLAEAELDFVDVCTPPSSHAALVRAALARDLHVLCEKPLVHSMAELCELVELATAAKRALYTVHNWHHAPIVRRARELAREGAIGRVTRVVWETLRVKPAATQDEGSGNWRLDPAVAGGGVLSDHGWHVFYILHAWLGELPTAVSARLETRRHTRYPVEDTATVRVTFPGASAEILLTWAADVRANRAELSGTAGSLELQDELLVHRSAAGDRRWPCPPPLSNGSVHPDWFDPVLDEFVAAARGYASHTANLLEASVCVALQAAAWESNRRGGLDVAVRPSILAGGGAL